MNGRNGQLDCHSFRVCATRRQVTRDNKKKTECCSTLRTVSLSGTMNPLERNGSCTTSCSLIRLTPNEPYMGRTAPLTSKRCVLYIYSTNICTEYFKHSLYSVFFSSKCSSFHNANLFGSCIIHILYTGCAKIKKK